MERRTFTAEYKMILSRTFAIWLLGVWPPTKRGPPSNPFNFYFAPGLPPVKSGPGHVFTDGLYVMSNPNATFTLPCTRLSPTLQWSTQRFCRSLMFTICDIVMQKMAWSTSTSKSDIIIKFVKKMISGQRTWKLKKWPMNDILARVRRDEERNSSVHNH